MTPVAIRSASRLRIAVWDERGYWLTDLDSPRRLLLDVAGNVVETSEPFPDAAYVPPNASYPPGSVLAAQVPHDEADSRSPMLPASVPHGWTVRWGDRWAVLAMSDKLFVGRGPEVGSVVRLEVGSDQIRAYPPGVVIHLFGSDHAFPWDAFDRAELCATPFVIELAPSVQRRVRVLQAGATMLRVEILEPEPEWRPTATLPSHGNPLGLAAGDLALAVGNEVRGQFAIAQVLRTELATKVMSAARGEPVRVGRSKAEPPAGIAELVRAGLVDSPEEVPEHTWLDTPVQALASIYEPRAALDRGFVWYSLKIWSDTRSLNADFARMAQTPAEGLKGIRFPRDGDANDLLELVSKVNARLAELGVSRRIYQLATEGPWYALIARTPTELAMLETAGLTVQ